MTNQEAILKAIEFDNQIHGRVTHTAVRPEGAEWHSEARMAVERRAEELLISRGCKTEIAKSYLPRYGQTMFWVNGRDRLLVTSRGGKVVLTRSTCG